MVGEIINARRLRCAQMVQRNPSCNISSLHSISQRLLYIYK